jgi:hypothetical protein
VQGISDSGRLNLRCSGDREDGRARATRASMVACDQAMRQLMMAGVEAEIFQPQSEMEKSFDRLELRDRWVCDGCQRCGYGGATC